jgi:hypothetical protein
LNIETPACAALVSIVPEADSSGRANCHRRQLLVVLAACAVVYVLGLCDFGLLWMVFEGAELL